MQLSVVILNYKVPYFLELCIRSVQDAISNLAAEIIVIDNNSEDTSCEMVRTTFPEVILIENKDNVGFSTANNQGVAIAKGEYVCILNPDTVVAEDTFEQLLKFAMTKDNLGIVGCKLIDGAGNFLPESKRFVPSPAIAIKKILGNDSEYYVSDLNQNDVGKVPVFVGAFMLMKKAVYNEVSGFDEDYFMYGEDIDLSYKIIKAGYENYYYGKTTVIHYKGESTLKDLTYAKRFYGAMQMFYKKHFRKHLLFDMAVFFGTRLLPLIPIKDEVLPEKEVITFDNNTMSYKDIIKEMEQQKSYYRIIPSNAKFSIGSDSSKNRGVVTFLD